MTALGTNGYSPKQTMTEEMYYARLNRRAQVLAPHLVKLANIGRPDRLATNLLREMRLGTNLEIVTIPSGKDIRRVHFGGIYSGFDLSRSDSVQTVLQMVEPWKAVVAGFSPIIQKYHREVNWDRAFGFPLSVSINLAELSGHELTEALLEAEEDGVEIVHH